MVPSPRVLLVDDSKVVRGVISNQLKENGFEITLAETGSDAFALSRAGGFDLIIAALEPPRIDAFELCERLREESEAHSIPLLLLTEETDEENIVRGFSAGASGFLVKSRIRLDLMPKIRNLLVKRRASRNWTFLIVEDSEAVRAALLEKLAWEGYPAVAVPDGGTALDKLRESRPDVVLCDLDMPGMDGPALFRAIQGIEGVRGVPFVIMGAERDRNAMREMMRQGAAACLFKPFQVSQLAQLAADMHAEAFVSIQEERSRIAASMEAATGQMSRMVLLLEDRDAYFRGHSDKVAEVSDRVAEALGLSDRERRRLNLAARLHDIGKIGVRDDILLKPGRLTEQEYEAVKRHSSLGADMLASIPELADLAPAVRGHHEKVDGSGYPAGLRGEDIPLFARIIAVADALHALTSERPYRQPVSRDEALRVMHEARGKQFCPKCLQALYASLGAGTREAFSAPSSRTESAVRSAPFPEQAAEIPEDAGPAPRYVLVVDTHKSLQQTLKQGLRKLGLDDVFLTQDGLSAWKLINDKPFEIVICSDDLPGMSGFDLAAKLRWSEEYGDLPLLMTLGSADASVLSRVKAIDLADFVVKPYSLKDLWEKAEGLIARRKSRQIAPAVLAPPEGKYPKTLVLRAVAAHELFCRAMFTQFIDGLASMEGEWGFSPEQEIMHEQATVFVSELKPLHLAENVLPLFDHLRKILSGDNLEPYDDAKDAQNISRRFLGMGMNLVFAHLRSVFPEDMVMPERSNSFHRLVSTIKKEMRLALETFDEVCVEILTAARFVRDWEEYCAPPEFGAVDGGCCDLHEQRPLLDAFGRALFSPLDAHDCIADRQEAGRTARTFFPRVFCLPVLGAIKTLFVGEERYESINATLRELVKKYCEKEDGFDHYELRLFFSQDKLVGYVITYMLSILSMLSSRDKRTLFMESVNNSLVQSAYENTPVFEKRHFDLLTKTWASFIHRNLHMIRTRDAALKILKQYPAPAGGPS